MIGFSIPNGVLQLFCVQKGSYVTVPDKYQHRADLLTQNVYSQDPNMTIELKLNSLNNISNINLTAGSAYHIVPLSLLDTFGSQT